MSEYVKVTKCGDCVNNDRCSSKVWMDGDGYRVSFCSIGEPKEEEVTSPEPDNPKATLEGAISDLLEIIRTPAEGFDTYDIYLDYGDSRKRVISYIKEGMKVFVAGKATILGGMTLKEYIGQDMVNVFGKYCMSYLIDNTKLEILDVDDLG